jgi:hypothetical protein
MIHLTVAAPQGIDSLFFSFVERLAVQNYHLYVNPPAERLDAEEPGHWIEALARSSQHHFVIGYRYPPCYWPKLVEHATTVAVLADGDGIARQLVRIHRQEQEEGEGRDIEQCMQEIRHALDAMVGITEWLLCNASERRLLVPSVAFHVDTEEAFRRMECFYQKAAVPVHTSCWQGFSMEARPLLDQIEQRSHSIRAEIHRFLSADVIATSRLEALEILFGEEPVISYNANA